MKITNNKAFYDYEIKNRFEAGINLYGAEVKAIRQGHADLTGSFVRIVGSEAYLLNAKIFPYEYARPDGYDLKRSRKLLLHKKEIISLKSKTEATNLTIVPISVYTTKNLIKVELAIGKPKKQFDKRQNIKKRDIERAVEEEFKQKLNWSISALAALNNWRVYPEEREARRMGMNWFDEELFFKNCKPTLITSRPKGLAVRRKNRVKKINAKTSIEKLEAKLAADEAKLAALRGFEQPAFAYAA